MGTLYLWPRCPCLLLLSAALMAAGALGGPARAQQQAPPPHRDAALQEKLEELTEGFRGRVGVYARHLPSGRTAALHADSLFPTASLVKVPILLATFAQIENGTLALDQALTFRDSLRYDAPEDLLVRFEDGAQITLGEAVMLMLTVSDNTAALWLKQLVGTAAGVTAEADSLFTRRWGRGSLAVNAWLTAHGFEKTRVNSGLLSRAEAFERYGWGQTTPREMAEMLVAIRQGEAVSPEASQEMYRALARSYWDDEALSQIPPTVQAASKQGWVERSRSEVVLVNAPHGDYVFTVITDALEDTRSTSDNEGLALIRAVSRTLWNHFEPASDWQPLAPSTSAAPVRDESLKAALQQIASRYPEAVVGVAVRNPATGMTAHLNADRRFHAASTMKVPVLIELFRQAERGAFALEDSIMVENRFRSIVDGSEYRIEDDSDAALYERLGQKVAIRELARRMITRSSNLATNLLIALVTPDSVQATIERLGAEQMEVLRGVEDIKAYRQGLSNTATARDLAALLEALTEGRAVSPEADSAMIEVLMAQEHNAMIPAGLPTGTRVAHKTGWITEIHHDAAIVYPEAGPPYVLVVLTEGLEDQDASARLGAEIARAVHRALRGSPPSEDNP